MEKPIPPNPDTMTDEEFDRWNTRGHKHTRGERSRLAEICCQSERKGHLARRLIYQTKYKAFYV